MAATAHNNTTLAAPLHLRTHQLSQNSVINCACVLMSLQPMQARSLRNPSGRVATTCGAALAAEAMAAPTGGGGAQRGE